jgi:DNA-binding transcriptional LysR family regulator
MRTNALPFERWHRIELRYLFAITAIAETGSFSAAAHRLGYVQSAISHQLAALENIVGRRLVERGRGSRPISLTPAGELFVKHANDILARVRAADADLAYPPDRTLTIGAYQTISSRIVPPLLRRVAERGLTLSLRDVVTDGELHEPLLRGDVDLIFTELPGPTGPYATTTLFSDPYVAIVASDSELSRRDSLTLAELLERPLVGHSELRPRVEQAPARTRHARDLCRAHGSERDDPVAGRLRCRGGRRAAVLDLRHDRADGSASRSTRGDRAPRGRARLERRPPDRRADRRADRADPGGLQRPRAARRDGPRGLKLGRCRLTLHAIRSSHHLEHVPSRVSPSRLRT